MSALVYATAGIVGLVIGRVIRSYIRDNATTLPPDPAGMDLSKPPKDVFEAADRGDVAALQSLIDQGGNADDKMSDGWTPLMSACRNGSIDVVRLLLARGADVNASLADGWTSLMSASRNGHAEIVQALLAEGAAVNARTTGGKGALALAKDLDVRAILITAGATE